MKRRTTGSWFLVLGSIVALGMLGLGGWLLIRSRMAQCAAVPLLADDLLPNASLVPGNQPRMPQGWTSAAPGVQLGAFDLDGDGRSLQLLGIANYAQTPSISVRAGQIYCFAGHAITDSDKKSDTRLRVVFRWLNAQGQVLADNITDWQKVVLWQQNAPPKGWSFISAAFLAPESATSLQVRFQPASDDRVYLDNMHVRQGGHVVDTPHRSEVSGATNSAVPFGVTVAPWPNRYRAALSFSFDWETAMGGLIHSRSVDDPNADQDWQLRAMRMRDGVTTTLDLFRPYGIRATYYATGYNFLLGNTARQQFMGNPVFTWATRDNRWKNDQWSKRPWFADDPYGTIQSDPGWYFGDLIPMLQREKQDIQSHTFSHLYGGLALADQWQADFQAWRTVATTRGVPSARSLAFPWSGSAGMSYANWNVLEEAGITSVTRTNWDPNRPQYHIVSSSDPHCRSVPGHERILACPDFYLHNQDTAAQALKLIDTTIDVSGTIDLWAHTEEVTSPEQIAPWSQVIRYAAQQRDAGKLWIAPLIEIADWQQALADVHILGPKDTKAGETSPIQEPGGAITFTVVNGSLHDLQGLTLMLPFKTKQVVVNQQPVTSKAWLLNALSVDIRSGQTLEVTVWPA